MREEYIPLRGFLWGAILSLLVFVAFGVFAFVTWLF